MWGPAWDCWDAAYIPPDILPGLPSKHQYMLEEHNSVTFVIQVGV